LKDDVNVNVIHPGTTDTERTNTRIEQRAKASGRSVEVVRKELVTRLGIRRMGTSEEIAALAVYLCGPQARHIQGVAISVDGGGTPGVY
jgi:NAD(P)-dependent dehydrogenase (short-subunit alcohol dehydrogenase family)